MYNQHNGMFPTGAMSVEDYYRLTGKWIGEGQPSESARKAREEELEREAYEKRCKGAQALYDLYKMREFAEFVRLIGQGIPKGYMCLGCRKEIPVGDKYFNMQARLSRAFNSEHYYFGFEPALFGSFKDKAPHPFPRETVPCGIFCKECLKEFLEKIGSKGYFDEHCSRDAVIRQS